MRAAAAMAVAMVALGNGAAHADTLEHIIGERAAIGLPAELAITAVHVPRSLAKLDLDGTRVDVDFPSAPRIGRASVKVRIAGDRPRTVFVPVTVAPLLEVAVATRSLVAGEVVSEGDVRWEHRAGAAAAAAPIGQQVAAPISAGEVLDDARLTAPPPVARGTSVSVEARRGGVVIQTRGKLEGSARIGARVRVRLLNGALIDGRLAAGGRVLVEAP